MILRREKQFQVSDGSDYESEEKNQNNTVFQNERNVINRVPLFKNILDFLATDFVEV
jgi:hypothetical protein